MRGILSANRWLIAAFGLVSGLFKVLGGQADIDLFAKVGLGPGMVSAFGAVQALAAVAALRPSTRIGGAVVLALCNAFATYGLWVAGVQPFGLISILFVVMALAVALPGPLRDGPSPGEVRARPSGEP